MPMSPFKNKQVLFFVAAFFLSIQSAAAMGKAVPQRIHFASEAIGVRTFEYVDKRRGRPVLVEFWYPTDRVETLDRPRDTVWIHPKETRDAPISKIASRYPLILMSHGHRGDRRERSWLADILVRNGFLVASIEHYGNTWNHYSPLISARFWERAKDISFALDQLLKEVNLKDQIDASRIGFVGYSLGGMTGLALAGAQARNTKELFMKHEQAKEFTQAQIDQIDFAEADKDYKEPRIQSMLLICPAIFVYSSETLKQIKIPIGLVAAINDEVLPHKDHAYKIIKHIVPYRLKIMRKEISHYTFLNRITETGQELLKKGIKDDPPCCDRGSIFQEVGSFAIDFFRETLK